MKKGSEYCRLANYIAQNDFQLVKKDQFRLSFAFFQPNLKLLPQKEVKSMLHFQIFS